MNEGREVFEFFKSQLQGQEERLRATESAIAKLTAISEQLTKSAEDREKRLRTLEADARLPHSHDEDHEDRLRRLEELLREKSAAPQPAIIANLSARELVFIGLAFTGFVTGKWDWLTGLFK